MYSTLLAASEGCFDAIPLDKVKLAEANLLRDIKHELAKEIEVINTGAEPDAKVKEKIIKLAYKIANSYKLEEKK
jgi:F0F1-type ATP synthase alpha subunit